jgi:LPXTG-site transpeptidase (sortase) family protein
MRNFASTLLISFGIAILMLSIFFLVKRNDPNRLQFNNSQISTVDHKDKFKVPTGIYIKSLSIRLPIILSKKKGDYWDTTSQGVSYLAGSPLPGENGNAILYGHNWGSILGNLYKVKPGDIIEVYFSNGDRNSFEIAYVQEVSPNDTSILKNTDDSRITLYTCSGIFDQKRFVVTAFLNESSPLTLNSSTH